MYCKALMKWIIILLPMTSGDNVISTVQGMIRGVEHEGYVSYNGIPYASIADPVMKFKAASIAPSWSGIRESQQSNCRQDSEVEECLQLDIHVPFSDETSLPTLVWVKGGKGHYNPGKLVQQGIVAVIVSHRLGVPGFLNSGDEAAPGNAGAKDVVLALRWIRDNIVAFKGNPNKVIVGGQSFGAAIVESLMLSPSANGFFHGAILQSGTVLSPSAFNYDAERRAKLLAGLFRDRGNITAGLIKASNVDLAINADSLELPYFPFSLSTEKRFNNEEGILYQSPNYLLSNKKTFSVPMIIGYNTDEAYVFASKLREIKVLGIISRNSEFLLPQELKFFNDAERKQVVQQLKNLYFDNIDMEAVLAYHRDAYFKSHIYNSVKYHTAASQFPVYFYQFSYPVNVGVLPEAWIRKSGAAHSDELAYLFPSTLSDLHGDDGLVQQHLIRLWTNFVKYLNPSAGDGATRWDPATSGNIRVLDINKHCNMKDLLDKRATEVWSDVYSKYYYARVEHKAFKE